MRIAATVETQKTTHKADAGDATTRPTRDLPSRLPRKQTPARGSDFVATTLSEGVWGRLRSRLRAVSSVGRAPARQAGGHWFEPSTAHLDPTEPSANRMVPWVRCATRAGNAHAVHTRPVRSWLGGSCATGSSRRRAAPGRARRATTGGSYSGRARPKSHLALLPATRLGWPDVQRAAGCAGVAEATPAQFMSSRSLREARTRGSPCDLPPQRTAPRRFRPR